MAFYWYVGGIPRDYELEHSHLDNRQVDPIDRVGPIRKEAPSKPPFRNDLPERIPRQAVEAYKDAKTILEERQPAITGRS